MDGSSNKILEYSPVINDTWKAINNVGTGSTAQSSNIPINNSNSSSSGVNQNPYYQQLLDTNSLISATSAIVSAKIGICLDTITSLYNHVSSYADNFPYTQRALQHVYSFWASMQKFISSLPLTNDSISKLASMQQDAYNYVEERGNIVQTLQNYGTIVDDNRLNLELRLTDIDNNMKSLKLDIDSSQANQNMIADINRSTYACASNCEYICSSLDGTITLDNEATNKLSSSLFDGLSSEDVKSIGGFVSNDVTNNLEVLKHIQDTSLSKGNVNSHFSDINIAIDKKTSITPKIKHILRNVDNNTDFTNVMISDMFNKCTELDNQFNETLLNHVKYMHAENTILLKTFSDEAKTNRFNTAYNAIQ